MMTHQGAVAKQLLYHWAGQASGNSRFDRCTLRRMKCRLCYVRRLRTLPFSLLTKPSIRSSGLVASSRSFTSSSAVCSAHSYHNQHA